MIKKLFTLLAVISLLSVASAQADTPPTSTIDPNVPAYQAPLTSAMFRGQFSAAYNDINALWTYAYSIGSNPTVGTSILAGNGAGGFSNVTIGANLTYVGGTLSATGGGGGGSVSNFSIVNSNGFSGTVANSTTTPALTISTTVNGIAKGNGTTLSAATAGTDYEVPLTFTNGVSRSGNVISVDTSQTINKINNLTTNGFVRTSLGDGSLSTSTSIVNSDINAAAAIDATKIGGGVVSNTEYSYLDGATSPLQTQLTAKQDAVLALNVQTASYALALADGSPQSKVVLMNVSTANTVTVLPNTSVSFPVGTNIPVCQIGAGATSIVQGSGVTVNSSQTLQLRTQYSCASLLKISTNTWLLTGDLLTP